MGLAFPSAEFFAALRDGVNHNTETFRRLGYFDCTFGVRVLDAAGGAKSYLLGFDVFECVEARESADLSKETADFVLEADAAVWREMFANIKANGGADAAHGINTLTHFGESMRCLYDDPDGHDKMFRFAESIQEFFNLAAGLDVDLRAAA
jgi:hypothetical protein